MSKALKVREKHRLAMLKASEAKKKLDRPANTVGYQGQPAPTKSYATLGTTSPIPFTRREERRLKGPKTPKPPEKKRGTKKGRLSYLDKLARKVGSNNYQDYLHSDHWKLVKTFYAIAWDGCRCIGCHADQYDLHHTTYARLGKEILKDLIPLCRTCHGEIHKFHRTHRIPLEDFRAALASLFDWDEYQLALRLSSYDALRD